MISNILHGDFEGMLHYLYVSAGETEFILRYPEECDKYTVEEFLCDLLV